MSACGADTCHHLHTQFSRELSQILHRIQTLLPVGAREPGKGLSVLPYYQIL